MTRQHNASKRISLLCQNVITPENVPNYREDFQFSLHAYGTRRTNRPCPVRSVSSDSSQDTTMRNYTASSSEHLHSSLVFVSDIESVGRQSPMTRIRSVMIGRRSSSVSPLQLHASCNLIEICS